MNNDLNSALALFQALYRAQKGDVYTIIERFILVGVKSKGLMSFTLEEIANMLKETFNIDIPISVIQKCVVSNQEVFRYSQKKYIVINPMSDEIDRIIEEMDNRESYREKIIAELNSFVEKQKGVTLSEDEVKSLSQLFFNFAIDKEHVTENESRLLITQFIIEKEKDEQFQSFLNAIREGMVIYKGIRYSDSPNDTSWEFNTDFFLDQEYLFSAYGMNGPFYQKCFFEFYDLVKEINNSSRLIGGRDRIRLFYFSETKNDVETYFAQAIRIRRMQERYKYPQTAMDTILNTCKEDVDIERYKTNFYRKLNELGISEYQDDIDLTKNKDYLFEIADFDSKKEKHFSPDQYAEVNDYIKIADYINILRQGKRCYPLEKCKYMFLSDGNLSNELSRFIRDYYTDKKPMVITRLGTFTELMWFKLRKGVVGSNSSATISVVNKAKTIVSGLLSDNLRKQYDAVQAMDANETDKKAFYADLRNKRYSPDDISSETIAEDIEFIDNEDYLEKYRATQDLLKGKAAKADELEKELEKEKKENSILVDKVKAFEKYVKEDKNRKLKKAFKTARKRNTIYRLWLKYRVLIVNLLLILVFVYASLVFMEFNFANICTVVGTFITVIGLVNGYFVKTKKRNLFNYHKRYRSFVREEME